MIHNRFRLSILFSLGFSMFVSQRISAQHNWFADGYHGGIYGHYPLWVTGFMADTLTKYPGWNINLEIEPETWDTVAKKDPQGYEAFREMFADQTLNGRIEYVNPTYAQSYLFPISGESIIRQFQYGMKKLKQHFPAAVFTTYSSEEPCFTSALPQILQSFGLRYAVLKNPNTCWGGYTRAYGGETVTWVGPDGTAIPAVPRYASEALEPNSTWQTTAWNNSADYLNAAIQQGINHPAGMCLQDAGWRNGRWLGDAERKGTAYTTWRNYFANIADTNTGNKWRLSQEDIQVSLVWGSQVLQRIAQQVRSSENRITDAEKIASLAKLLAGYNYPASTFDSAWRTLLLSQHHDCWIVPYNGKPGHTWADEVKQWTEFTNRKSDTIISQSAQSITGNQPGATTFAVYNTSPFERDEIISLPDDRNNSSSNKKLLVRAKVPALGYIVVTPLPAKRRGNKAIVTREQPNGYVIMETNLYKLIINPAKGGAITSLIAKQMNNKEFVDRTSSGLNVLRGNFYKNGGQQSTGNTKADVTILENGPVRGIIKITGTIAGNPYTQVITMMQGEEKIDCELHIDYAGNLRVGEDYKQDSGYDAKDLHKAFYNDTSKLIAQFPLSFPNQKIYKDAPFDVTESRLSNTFFNRWDSIKNNILLHWVDVTDGSGKYGFALLTDHTTSYVHGEQFPLGITVQYAGVGLWGRNYKTDSATNIHYALLPHTGKWDEARLNRQSEIWNHPLFAEKSNKPEGTKFSLMDLKDANWQMTSVTYEGNDLLARFYNAEGDDKEHNITFNATADRVESVQLNNNIIETLSTQQSAGKTNIHLSIPRFGIRTLRFVNARR